VGLGITAQTPDAELGLLLGNQITCVTCQVTCTTCITGTRTERGASHPHEKPVIESLLAAQPIS